MTPEEILEGNKLIAIFMGYTYYPWNHPDIKREDYAGWKTSADTTNISKFNHLKGQRYLCRTHNQLRYDKDWNWLIPVVEKIEQMGWGCKMYLNGCSFPTAGSNLWPIAEEKKIHAVFDAVNIFVEWYNENMFASAQQKITIGDDNICPTTGKECDDETCMPGGECNIADNELVSGEETWCMRHDFPYHGKCEICAEEENKEILFAKWIRERSLEPYGSSDWRDRKDNRVYTTEKLHDVWKEKQ